MDPQNIITAFITSANQYSLCQTDNNLMNLQRHLEILLCLTSNNTDYFRSYKSLASQCIVHITNILLDSNVKISLIPRVLTILQNLAKDFVIKKQLQSTFHVHSAVSVFLQNYSFDFKDNLVLQCFHLLESITYDITIDYLESHLEHLINVLLNIVDKETPECLEIALHLLANVCRRNLKVQKYISGLANVKQIIKKLVSMLRKQESHIVLYTLAILASLTPSNSILSKLWTDEHLKMTFELILKLLFEDDINCALAALDLFTDLSKVSKYQLFLCKSNIMSWSLKKLSKTLSNETIKHSHLYLKFLFTLTMLPDVCQKICSILCLPVENDNKSDTEELFNIHPFLIRWCIQDKDEYSEEFIISLKLLKAIVLLYNNEKFNAVEKSVKDVLEKIVKAINMTIFKENDFQNEQFDVLKTMFEIIILLQEKANLGVYISEILPSDVCENLAKNLLEKYAAEECNNINECFIDLFFMTIRILSFKNCDLYEVSDNFQMLLKDERTMRIIALALTSTNSKHINSALSFMLLSKNNDTFTVLSESLSQRNSSIQRRMSQNSELLDSMVSLNENYVQPSKKILYSSTNASSELKLDSLLSKIETGLNIKDLKRSEIMDLYEHKIAILTRKEKELQNYVDAKTCALQEADRVMAQYKCRQADADAEAWALRNMLKDLEYRYEKASSQLEEYQVKQRKLENDLEKAWQTSSELQKNISEQKEFMHTQITRLTDQKKMVEEEKTKLSEQNALKEQEKRNLRLQIQQCDDELKTKHKAYKELEEKHEELGKLLEETKKSLEKSKINYEQKQQDLERITNEAEQKISALEEKNEALANEMAEKEDDFSRKISALMIKNDELNENIKCRDLKITELNESLRKLNDAFNKKCSFITELTKSNEQLKASIEEAEEFKEKLSKEVEMLQLLCKRYERTLDKKEVELKNVKDELAKSTEEKNSRIRHLEEELDKHEYIKTMIHQMTSGKGLPPKT